MGFSRQEYWSGLPFPSPGDLPDPGIEPGSPALEADALTSELSGKHIYACICIYMFLRSTPWNMNVFIRSAENEDQEYRNSQVTVKAWSETHQVVRTRLQGFPPSQNDLETGSWSKCLHAESCLTLCNPWTVARQPPLSNGFPRQEYWRGLPFPSKGIFLTQGSNLLLRHWQAGSL